MSTNQNKVSVKWAAVTLGVLVVVIGVSVAALSLVPEKKVTDFESCRAAGGAILEMYPEQCRINGASYTNEAQTSPRFPESVSDGREYVGLTEDEALAKAEKEDITARVVERDDEQLPVTLDFMYGRHNLHVKKGLVHKVEVEGLATDAH